MSSSLAKIMVKYLKKEKKLFDFLKIKNQT